METTWSRYEADLSSHNTGTGILKWHSLPFCIPQIWLNRGNRNDSYGSNTESHSCVVINRGICRCISGLTVLKTTLYPINSRESLLVPTCLSLKLSVRSTITHREWNNHPQPFLQVDGLLYGNVALVEVPSKLWWYTMLQEKHQKCISCLHVLQCTPE